MREITAQPPEDLVFGRRLVKCFQSQTVPVTDIQVDTVLDRVINYSVKTPGLSKDVDFVRGTTMELC